MNLFARILSHGFALVVVALLAIGLIYRGELFPEWKLPDFISFGQEHEDAGAESRADTGRLEESERAQSAGAVSAGAMPAAPEAAQAPSAAIDRGTTEAADASAAAGQETRQAPAAGLPSAGVAEAGSPASAVHASPGELVPSPGREPEGTAAVPVDMPAHDATAEKGSGAAEMAGLGENNATVVSGEVERAEETYPGNMDVPAETGTDSSGAATVTGDTSRSHAAAPKTSYKILAAAREAYWLRDYAVAELKYEELIAQDPDNPDGYGELGNMYFSQGDWDKASASYYDAGLRLTAEGLYDRARQLVEVIRGLNGKQADDLERRIVEAESSAN